MIIRKDAVNAFLDYGEVEVPSAAEGPLENLNFAVKDIFDVAGYPTGGGSPVMAAESQVHTTSAPIVQKMLDAGARFIGKTQTDELTFSMNGQNKHYPEPINPRADGRITGGSSSGSAAAVAAELCDFAIGSDTGGSVRAPASYCGLFGIRPTHGRVDNSR
jgi:amidase